MCEFMFAWLMIPCFLSLFRLCFECMKILSEIWRASWRQAAKQRLSPPAQRGTLTSTSAGVPETSAFNTTRPNAVGWCTGTVGR